MPSWLRERVALRSRLRCGYCLTAETITGTALVVDRLIPEALGGAAIEDNLWMACNQCNLHKADRITARDPITDSWVPLFNPRRQVWSEHFAWTPTADYIVGLTPIGRGTVQALQLNRSLLAQVRRGWVKAGWHPPVA